jgi:HAD superfamily hydrolase (TIGR01509 family)
MEIDLSPYDFLLFDVDGTIAETEALGHLPAFNESFRHHSIPWQWDAHLYKSLLKITGGLERMKSYRETLRNSGSIPSSLPNDQILKKAHLTKNQIYAQLVAEGKVRPRQGLTDFINSLVKNGKRWGVVTTTSHSNWSGLWTSILAKEIHSNPAIVICGEDVVAKKPDPQAYELAIQKLNVLPDICLAVEDSVNGVLAARRAKLDVLTVRSHFFIDEDFSDSKVVVDEFTELVPHY